MTEDITNPVRKWRSEKGLSLEDACDLFVEHGFRRPSIAKLSRIERDQHVPIEMIPKLEKITGIAARLLRPDLAELFQ